MRRFIKYIALFSFLICIMLAIGELIVRHIPTSYTKKDEWIHKNGNKVNTLILGSSHTYYGIKPEILGDSTFNLANISQTPEYDEALLESYLPLIPNLKRIIIPISYFTFRDPRLETMSPELCVNYKVGMHLPIHSDFSIYNLSIYDFKAYCGRLRGLVLHQDSNDCDSLGFGLGFDLSHRSSDWIEGGEARARELTISAPGRPLEVFRTFEKMINLCRENGIECIFITTPVWQSFRDHADKSQYAEMQKLTKTLTSKYRLRYFDWYDSNEFTDEDFHDSDHLSDIGAEKMSRMLGDSITKH